MSAIFPLFSRGFGMQRNVTVAFQGRRFLEESDGQFAFDHRVDRNSKRILPTSS